MLPNAVDKLWPEKYRPKTIDEYIFNNPMHKVAFGKILDSKVIPHMMLSGVQGTGKTAIAQILIAACIEDDVKDTDVLVVNASDQNSVENVRNEIKSHILSYGMGQYKVILLQEADYLSPNAQGILRDYMEEYEQNCRFILTCNYRHKIIPAIQSRCQQFEFKAPDRDDIAARMLQILKLEGIKLSSKDADTIYDHIESNYPDVRAIINSLQQHTDGDNLLPPASQEAASDYKLTIMDNIKSDKWDVICNELAFSVSDNEWEDVFEVLYQNLDQSPKFKKDKNKWGDGIVAISDHLDRHYRSGKPHINGTSLIIQLGNL